MNKCFQFLDVMNKVTMNIHVEVLVYTYVFIFLERELHKKLQSVFKSHYTILHSYQQYGRVAATYIFANTF